MKSLIQSLLGFIFFSWAYPDYDYRRMPVTKMAQYFIAQKILGINRRIPWPVHWTSQVKGYERIERGTEELGSMLCNYIDGRNGIILEDNVWVGPRVSIISMDHELTDYNQYKADGPIRIGRDSLLTTNCIILPGVELGPHTVVAAGAVVTKSFPEGNQILAGNPAKVIRRIDPYITVGSVDR